MIRQKKIETEQLQKAEQQVIDVLEREVRLMRELLANLLEEERTWRRQDIKALQLVMVQRDLPLQELMRVREERNECIHSLMHLLEPSKSKNKDSIALLIESSLLESSEVLLLRDQLIALIEKMNIQQACNTHLMQEHLLHWQELIQGHPIDMIGYVQELARQRQGTLLSVINPET